VLDKVIDTPIPLFNDRPTTTHKDILEALDAAIVRSTDIT
jgi:hypothetical protein